MNGVAAKERPWPVQLARFALVGVIGFLVDAGSLTAYLALMPGHFFTGRAVSYVVAASATWALNSWFTFGRSHRSGLHQWGRFLVFNLSGGAINYAVYAVLVSVSVFIAHNPIIAVAIGSLSGLSVNFLVSKKFVFAVPS